MDPTPTPEIPLPTIDPSQLLEGGQSVLQTIGSELSEKADQSGLSEIAETVRTTVQDIYASITGDVWRIVVSGIVALLALSAAKAIKGKLGGPIRVVAVVGGFFVGWMFYNWLTGQNNPFYGDITTEEVRSTLDRGQTGWVFWMAFAGIIAGAVVLFKAKGIGKSVIGGLSAFAGFAIVGIVLQANFG